MNIFKLAAKNKRQHRGYRSKKSKLIWENKKCSWNWLAIEYGIRWSNNWQIWPIKNTSNNTYRQITIGFWKLYFALIYCRKNSFNQRDRFMMNRFRKFYQLIN